MTRISSSCTKGDQQIPEEIFDMAEDMFAYGLPENANDADIIAYAHYCLEQYEKNGWKSGDLSEFSRTTLRCLANRFLRNFLQLRSEGCGIFYKRMESMCQKEGRQTCHRLSSRFLRTNFHADDYDERPAPDLRSSMTATPSNPPSEPHTVHNQTQTLQAVYIIPSTKWGQMPPPEILPHSSRVSFALTEVATVAGI